MTAKAERAHFTGWQSRCPECRCNGPRREYKGQASADAREHNAKHHGRQPQRLARE